jgi:asparagine synthase (glutamine-hydrolysing)
MCGILGVVNSQKSPELNRFEASLTFLKHRGPDNRSLKQVDEGVVLGHARLSIIDLSETNNQPFAIDNRYTIVYNGEVYNYIEIRNELIAKGLIFRTAGDTEVVLIAYKVWGEECVKKFNGMWAFAIYDKVEKKLFCSRDRFGVKPFNYFFSQGEFIFSSEIKPILHYKPDLRTPNHNLIANYVYKSLGAQADQTWFKDILRLPPSHNLVLSNGKITTYRYWEYPQKVNHAITFDEAQKEFDRIFRDAVRIRMRSDVKVGSTLSSGLDSSSIVGVLHNLDLGKIETFTAYSRKDSFTQKDTQVFKEDIEIDESIVVEKLASYFNVHSNLIEVSVKNYLQKLNDTIYFLESGHSSPATISIHQVYKEARKKVKVLLEGQGADELLAGYVVDTFPYYIFEEIKTGKIVKALKELIDFSKVYSFKYQVLLALRRFDSPILNSLKNSFSGISVFNNKIFEYKYISDNRKENVKFDESFNHMLYKHHSSGLVNLLHYGDALSMAESIECRLPFMDYRLVEFAFSLPYNFKLNLMQGKYIQRKALEKYLPDYITKSLIKIGFVTPLDRLISESKEIENILLNETCGSLFDCQNIGRLLNKHRQGKQNYSTLLFRILSVQLWYRIFIESKTIPEDPVSVI